MDFKTHWLDRPIAETVILPKKFDTLFNQANLARDRFYCLLQRQSFWPYRAAQCTGFNLGNCIRGRFRGTTPV